MNISKKGWMLAALPLAAMSMFAVHRQAKNLSISDLHNTLRLANKGWLCLALVSMVCIIICEGMAIRSILSRAGYERGFEQNILFAAGDIYFSSITPSASGGQPASALFMRNAGIPLSVITAVLLINLVMYTAGILTIGLICSFKPHIFLNFNSVSRFFILFGYAALICVGSCFVLLLTKRKLAETIGKKILSICQKLHILHDPAKKSRKLKAKMDDYECCVTHLRGNKAALFAAFVWNLLQRVAKISITVFIFLATGGKLSEAGKVWTTQAFAVIGSNMVPIPGGMGISDYLMLDGFRSILPNEDAVQLEILSRSLAFYVCILVSGLMVGAGYLLLVKRKGKNE